MNEKYESASNKYLLNFKSFSINYKTIIPFGYLAIKEINDLLVNVSIDNYYKINNNCLFVKGSILSILEYQAFSIDSINCFKINVPFSITLKLSASQSLCNKFFFAPIIDFRTAYLLNSRVVCNTVGITLLVKN